MGMQREETCAYEVVFRYKKLLFLKFLKRESKAIDLHYMVRHGQRVKDRGGNGS